MATHALSLHFASFFKRLNPGASFEATAAREYGAIKSLIENPTGPAAVLGPKCFLQGSYRQQTAIYTINDVDVVALCELWQPGSGTGVRSWGRNEIFQAIASPLLASPRYRPLVRFGPNSMCIKVDLGIKVEILPVVYKSGNSDPTNEPFRLFRPETGQWEDGYARYHQYNLSAMNAPERTGGNLIPMIKVLKHLRSRFGPDAVSFHLECLLHCIPDEHFYGAPADYIPEVLSYFGQWSADIWWTTEHRTPCGERNIFNEWGLESWRQFHANVGKWAAAARAARDATDKATAIKWWQALLDEEFFPVTAT